MQKLLFSIILMMLSQQPALALELDFYVYGDFDSTVGAFQRVALIFADNDYIGLFFITCVFGLFSGGVTLFWRGLWNGATAGQLMEYIFYPLMGAALYASTIMQTGTLHIFDESQNKYQAVGELPDGLIFVAGTFNKFERIVSDVASNNPATVRSSLASGTGIKLFLDAFAKNPLASHPELNKSLHSFIIQCMDLSMISNNNLNLEYLRSQAPNARQVLSYVDNQAIQTKIFNDTGGHSWLNCKEASANIIDRLDKMNIDAEAETLCINAGYEIGGPDAVTERQACYQQLEDVASVFMGSVFNGSTRELFTNIAVYNTIATNINDANITVNGLGSRQIASEGIASLTITEHWLPQIRGGLLVTILSMFLLISFFLVTPLFGKAIKLMYALFFFLAFWGASSSLLLMSAYDQVIYAARSIAHHGGGLEAYLMAPTTAVQGLAIIGDSLSTAMMFAAALTTLFTGISAYGFSNALAHASGKVEGIGDQQGRNLTHEGKAEVTDRNASSFATNTVSGAMGPEDYGSSHVQDSIVKNYSSVGRADGISDQGGVPSHAAYSQGLSQGGSMVPTSNLKDPSAYGSASKQQEIGSITAQNERARAAGGDDIIKGAKQLEMTRSSSTASTLKAHDGETAAVDQTTLTNAKFDKGHAQGIAQMVEIARTSVEKMAGRSGHNLAAENISSEEQYQTPQDLLTASQAKAGLGAGQLAQNVKDAQRSNPDKPLNQSMKAFGQTVQGLANNPAIASKDFDRQDLINSEITKNVQGIAEHQVNDAVAREFFTREGGPLDTQDKIEAAVALNPQQTLSVNNEELIPFMEKIGAGHLATHLSKDDISEISGGISLDEQGNFQISNPTVGGGASVTINDSENIRVGQNKDIGDRINMEDQITGNTLYNAMQETDSTPEILEDLVDQIGNMSPADQLRVFEEFNQSLPTPFQGSLETTDTNTFNMGLEAHGGVNTGMLQKVGIDAGVRGVTNTYHDNIDSKDSGAKVKVAGIQMQDKFNEIAESVPFYGDFPYKGAVVIGNDDFSHDMKMDRFADYLSHVYQTSQDEGETAIQQDDVNDTFSFEEGKTGNLLRGINEAETQSYQQQGWKTGEESESVANIREKQRESLTKEALLYKKINLYNIN